MQLLDTDQLFVLELLATELERKPPRATLTLRESEALRLALPRWIKMERTVGEAHDGIMLWSEPTAFPDFLRPQNHPYIHGTPEDYWDPADQEHWDRPGPTWWERLKAWWRRKTDEAADAFDE